jgi:hypothetical protein
VLGTGTHWGRFFYIHSLKDGVPSLPSPHTLSFLMSHSQVVSDIGNEKKVQPQWCEVVVLQHYQGGSEPLRSQTAVSVVADYSQRIPEMSAESRWRYDDG